MLKIIQEEENILCETRELFVEWCIENEALCGTVLFHLSQVYQCTTSMSVKWTTLRSLDIYITNEALGPSIWPNWYFDNATHRVENFNVSVMELLCTHRFVTVNYCSKISKNFEIIGDFFILETTFNENPELRFVPTEF